MHSGWRQERNSAPGLIGSIAVQALALLAFLLYREQLPRRAETQPPLDVVVVPSPLASAQPKPAAGGAPSSDQPDETATARTDTVQPNVVTPVLPSPLPPIVAIPARPFAALPHADEPPKPSGSATPGVGRGTAGTGTGPAAGRGAGGIDEGAGLPPVWIRQATVQDWADYYPRTARSVTGRMEVILSCLVTPKTRVQACRLIDETPRGYGIGEAVLRMSKVFRVKPPMVDGEPRYDVRVGIRMVLTPPDDSPANIKSPFRG
jgi:protein TonB